MIRDADIAFAISELKLAIASLECGDTGGAIDAIEIAFDEVMSW